MSDDAPLPQDDYESASDGVANPLGIEAGVGERLARAVSGEAGAAAAFNASSEVLENFYRTMPKVVFDSSVLFSGIESTMRAIAASMPTLELPVGFREVLANAQSVALPPDFYESFAITARLLHDSVSLPRHYSPKQLQLRSDAQKSKPRTTRSAEAFFAEREVEVTDVKTFLRALAVIQSKHHEHKLVWRGQKNSAWSFHSSLYRKLEVRGVPGEEDLVHAERASIFHALKWGERPPDAMAFLADLQHYGAPTRLLDVTADPEIAAWFATEADPGWDERDGRLIAWGRVVRIGQRKVSVLDDDVYEREDSLFWHSWKTDEERGRVGWGTGSRAWAWFPPALSERMRVQRAGFLLEAGPLVTPSVAESISSELEREWRVPEIIRATSIVGLPSRHDVRTAPNAANLVPIFSLRIAAQAKEPIREYLLAKGLTYQAVYPDRGGLVSFLNGPFGLDS